MEVKQQWERDNVNNKLKTIGNYFGKKLFVREKFVPYQKFELNLRWKPHKEFKKNFNWTYLGKILMFAGGCRDGPYKITIKFWARLRGKSKCLQINFKANLKHINVTDTWQGWWLGLDENIIFTKGIKNIIQNYYNNDPFTEMKIDAPLISIYSLRQFFPDEYTRRRDLYDEHYDRYCPLLKWVVGWSELVKLPKNKRWVNIKLTIKNETNIGRMDYPLSWRTIKQKYTQKNKKILCVVHSNSN